MHLARQAGTWPSEMAGMVYKDFHFWITQHCSGSALVGKQGECLTIPALCTIPGPARKPRFKTQKWPQGAVGRASECEQHQQKLALQSILLNQGSILIRSEVDTGSDRMEALKDLLLCFVTGSTILRSYNTLIGLPFQLDQLW